MNLGPTEIMILLGALVVLVAIVAFVGIAVARRTRRPAEAPPSEPVPTDGTRIALDIEDADPDDPSVQRLAHDAAAHVFAMRPEVEHLDVTTKTGKLIVRVDRHADERPEPGLPTALLEPHARPKGRPGEGVGAERGPTTTPAQFADGAPSPHRTLAEGFDLPEAVKARLTNPDETVDIVRAICEAAGVDVSVDGNVIRAGDEALVVIGTPLGTVVDPEDLNEAFFAFQRSGARRGVVVTPGLLYPTDLRKRQAMAPSLLHAGPEGIQRMADAVALGANPLRFATGPGIVSD